MFEIAATLILLAFGVPPLGTYLARVLKGEQVFLSGLMAPLERGFYALCGVDEKSEMSWRQYALALMLFSGLGFAALYAVLLFQHFLPLNPQHLPGLQADLAFNVAISFLTNTNWQSYSGEATMSHFSQTVGLTTQHFLSAATGMAVATALARAFTRKQTSAIGNFWVDMTRALLYVLLPLSLLFALVLASQGVVQTYAGAVTATTLEGAPQTIALGPVASQIAIKMLGSNGGGFFNANGAHPFENPSGISNILQSVSILLLPAAMLYAFGVMVGDRRQGLALLLASLLLFVPLFGFAAAQENVPNPAFPENVDQSAGNMEGKEVRFGVLPSVFWAAATTATSNGSTNAAHDSLMPLAGLMPLLMMQKGEVVFGGVGSGLYGLLLFVVITVFIGGLMVGRTPEYLGKKLGPFEIKMASLGMLIPCMIIVAGAAIAMMAPAGASAVLNPGAQSFSEILYAFTSAAANNGSAFAGLNANSPFYNTVLGIVMFLGRFFVIIPVLAMAGSISAKNTVPPSPGTMPTHNLLFVLMLAGVILLLGVLTYAPALVLGPVAEHFHLYGGRG